MSDLTIQELMSRMPAALIPEKAAGVDAVIQYHLSGKEPGDWVITIRDGKCSVEQGNAVNPKLTLTADSDDYKGVVMGTVDGMQAFMQGKLKLAGDLMMAMKLTSFFKLK